MKKVVDKNASEEVSIDKAGSYLGLKCNEYNSKYILLFDHHRMNGIYTLGRGSSIITEDNQRTIEEFYKHYTSIGFTLYSFDSMEELMEWHMD